MANAVVALNRGWTYQARLFWWEAVRLFVPDSPVQRVGHEVDPSRPDTARAFDDVVVFYAADHPAPGEFGKPVVADHYQAKFRSSNATEITADALMDPAFIGATTVSLLQRARDAQEKHAPGGVGHRFTLVSPWRVASTDPLGELVVNNGGYFDLDKLMKPRFKRQREAWCQHLGCDDDEDRLRHVLATFRIRSDFGDLQGMHDLLERIFPAHGLAWFGHGASSKYDDLPRKFADRGMEFFTRDELEEELRRENLWVGIPAAARPVNAIRVGVRSYMRAAEHMEDETDSMRCFVGYFDGRWIRDEAHWAGVLLPELASFLTEATRGADIVHLHLDTHPTLAFAAGWILDTKSGVAAYPVQKGRGGLQTWNDRDLPPCADSRVWDHADDIILNESAPDVALILSVTHPAGRDALAYISSEVSTIGRAVQLVPCGGTGQRAIRDAAHGRRLAQDAVARALEALHHAPRPATLHIFAAAPNGLLFFLGREARGLGRCSLYEHDFGRERDAAYTRTHAFGSPAGA